MANETFAYFAVDGPGDSAVVTRHLGCEPSRQFSEGDPRPSPGTGVYQEMKWMLDSRLAREGEVHEILEAHIADVLSQVAPLKSRLLLLRSQYSVYVQCVTYHHGPNPAFGLSSELLAKAADLGIGIDFDIYSLPDGPEDA